ncbi:aquaporin-8a.1 [Esox lucius]|uniref:Aquaporin-4 n=1 Tax=Esox lucius TaxID=8010 RepID=A0A3P8YSZ2_ESOLU|nr:aquaporin-8a.1 [Esox lucius]XP_034148306.1 aquaporin-8a.1 [Esox lucius]
MSTIESKSELFTVADTTVEQGSRPVHSRKVVAAFERYVQPCVAEVVGCTLFIFVGCGSVIENTGVPGSIQPALAHGLALAIVIAVLGQISGGHFNPAVSVGVCVSGGLELILLGPYILSQMVGGMIGAGLAKAVFSNNSYTSAEGGAFNIVETSEAVGRATAVEMVMTLFLSLVVCMAAINARTRTPLAPLCVGLTVTANILAGGSISGGCMNPARAFGPAVAANYWEYHWIYWVGPVAGAIITGSLVRLMLGDQKTRLVLK